MEISRKDIEQFVAAARKVGERNLTRCSSGNLSQRKGAFALVSATGSWLSDLTPEEVAICRIADGSPANGVKPSMESVFHLGILRSRPEINVVLHCQSIYATTVACMKEVPSDFNVTAEIACHCAKGIGWVPYLRPGSPELAEAVQNAMLKRDVVLMKNHGQVYAGSDFREVLERAEFVEMVCQILVLNRGNCTTLSPAEIEDWQNFIRERKKGIV